MEGTRLIILPGLVHFTCHSEALSLPSKTTLSFLFPFSPFLCVNNTVSHLFQAGANLRAPFLLFILPVLFWPKIFALMPAAQVSSQRSFPWRLSVVSIVTLAPITLVLFVFTALITL